MRSFLLAITLSLSWACSSEPGGGTTPPSMSDARADAPRTESEAGTTPDASTVPDGNLVANIDAGETACNSSAECPANRYCDFGGACEAPGVCKVIPECGMTGTPVCGCDETTYDSACLAYNARVSVAAFSTCESQLNCDAMDAIGSGSDVCPLGFKWNGNDCTEVRGCDGCEGSDCDKLFSLNGCQIHKVQCEAI